MNTLEQRERSALHHDLMSMAHKWEYFYGCWAKSQGISLNELLMFDFMQLEKGVSPRDIALSCRIPKQTLTGMLREMEQRCEITFEPNPDDARGKLVFLTEKGRQRRTEVVGTLHQAEQDALDAMGEQQAKQLITCTNSFLNNLQLKLNIDL